MKESHGILYGNQLQPGSYEELPLLEEENWSPNILHHVASCCRVASTSLEQTENDGSDDCIITVTSCIFPTKNHPASASPSMSVFIQESPKNRSNRIFTNSSMSSSCHGISKIAHTSLSRDSTMLWISWEKPNLSRVLRTQNTLHKDAQGALKKERQTNRWRRSWHSFQQDLGLTRTQLFFWLLDAFLRSPERNGYGTRTATESYSCSSPKIPRALNFCAAHGGFASPISERLKNLKSAKRFSALHTELIPQNHFGGNQFGTIRNSPGIRCYDPVLQRQQNARGEASCSEHQCSRCHTSPGTDPLNESKL